MIEFRNIKNDIIFSFADFSFNRDEYFNLIFYVKIVTELFCSTKKIECELNRFVELRNDFEKLINNQSAQMKFCTFERDLEIDLKKDSIGHLEWKIVVRNFYDLKESHIYTEFTSDLSFVNDIVLSINEELDGLNLR